MKTYIYADNAATSKLDIEAFEVMKKYMLEEYGNASQLYSFSRNPKLALREARSVIAECINAEPEEIFFTSGGTESDNWALKESIHYPATVVTSTIEHHAILNTCKHIKKNGGSVKYVDVDKFGVVDKGMFAEYIKGAQLVSIMFVNNEIGTIEPIAELVQTAHKENVLFHTDAVQALGHIPVDVKKLGVDLLSASAHKFNGPKGIGFLYVKQGVLMSPYIDGGKQERGLRAGTENIASIVGMAVALKNNIEKMNENSRHIRHLENTLIQGLVDAKIDFIRNGINHVPGNLSLSFKGYEGEMLLHRLDLLGICVSTGSACDSVNTQVSHVLKAIRLDKEYAEGTIRISLGKNNTESEARKISNAIVKIVKGKNVQ